jgi:hypothetical protein
MKLFYQRQIVFTVLVASLLAACANTVVLNAWRDKGYDNTPLKKVLVVTGLQRNSDSHQLQDALVMQLKESGVEAIAGYTVFKGSGHPAKEQVMKYAIQNQVDSILVSRITGENTEAIYHPSTTYGVPYPYYSYWDTYYPRMYDRAGFAAKYKYYYLESNIYAVYDKKLVWTAVSEAMDPKNMANEIKVFANQIVSAIKSSALI